MCTPPFCFRQEPVIIRSDVGSGGSRDIHLENFSLSNGGAELIENASLTLAYGRRYGLIGRNGTGKSTFLRAFAGKEIDGIPRNIQARRTGSDASAPPRTACAVRSRERRG